jgi:hypothetical protein
MEGPMNRNNLSAAMVIILVASVGACAEDAMGAPTDGGVTAAAVVVTEFDGAAFELPESLAYYRGLAYVSFLNGSVVTVAADGVVRSFGAVPIEPAGSAYGLGVAVGSDGSVYLAMAAASAESTFAPGVYQIPASGGEGTLFASHPELYIPNDIAVAADGTVYVTADGRVYRTGAEANLLDVWAEDALLASTTGDASAPCGPRTSPFPIGANGIEVESDRVVVGNTELGSLVAIPVGGDGTAGSPAALVTDTALLCGVDGLVGDADGSYLVTALGTSLLRVSPDGVDIVTLHSGAPFRSPAGVDVGAFGDSRQAIVSSPDFHAAFGEGGPASAVPTLITVSL